MTDQHRHIASRVSRLESHLLDRELNGTIDGLVDQLEIPNYGEEIKAILRLYLFVNYVGASATAGMKVYNMNYCDVSSTTHNQPLDISPKHKLVLYSAFNLVGSYILMRYQKVERLLQNLGLNGLNLPWLNLDNAAPLYKSLNVLNFFAFLKNGKYLTIPERILGLAPAVTDEGHFNNTHLHRVQMEYMYRETVWKAIAEFLTTMLPLVNFEQIKNRISQLTGSIPKLQSEMKLSDKMQRETNATSCAICFKQPFNPYIIGCRHVFCYYCMQSKYLSDPSIGYVCMLCHYSTNDESVVHRYKAIGHMH